MTPSTRATRSAPVARFVPTVEPLTRKFAPSAPTAECWPVMTTIGFVSTNEPSGFMRRARTSSLSVQVTMKTEPFQATCGASSEGAVIHCTGPLATSMGSGSRATPSSPMRCARMRAVPECRLPEDDHVDSRTLREIGLDLCRGTDGRRFRVEHLGGRRDPGRVDVLRVAGAARGRRARRTAVHRLQPCRRPASSHPSVASDSAKPPTGIEQHAGRVHPGGHVAAPRDPVVRAVEARAFTAGAPLGRALHDGEPRHEQRAVVREEQGFELGRPRVVRTAPRS